MSKLPKGWKNTTIGDNVKFSGGAQPPRNTFLFEETEGYIRLLQIRDYKTDKFKTYIPFNLARKFCTREDIMIGRYGPPIFQILRGLEGAYNVALIKAIPEENVNKEFVYFTLKQESLFNLIDSLSQRSSGQTGIDMEQLKSYPMPLPPIEEQKKIADILSTVDKKIAFVEENINATEELKKGLMQKLLTEGIGHTEFKDSELGRIPETWESAKIGEVCKFSQGVQIPIEEQLTEKQENYIRFLRISDYTQNTTDIRYVPNSYNNSIISEEEIVMVRYGETAGFIGRGFEGVLANNLFTINPINKNLSKDFIYIFMKQPSMYNYLKNLRAAGAMPAVNFKSLSIIKLPIPPLEEQKEIAEILSTVDKKLENLKEKKQSFEELKKGLMQKLLTGEVRV